MAGRNWLWGPLRRRIVSRLRDKSLFAQVLHEGYTSHSFFSTGHMREIPIQYQIACVILTALFIWSFSIAREPRGWRRLFQSMFSKSEKFSVNKNKVIDEALKKYGIVIAMIILVADVSCFVMGVTHPFRERAKALSKQERDSMSEINKIQGNNPEAARRSALP